MDVFVSSGLLVPGGKVSIVVAGLDHVANPLLNERRLFVDETTTGTSV